MSGISEHALQAAVAEYLDWVLRPPIWWTAIDHAGKLPPRQAAMRKKRGVKRGLPDILIIAPGPNVLGIELKRPGKGGSQSPEQLEVETGFHGCKAWYVLCRSVEEVGKALDFIKVPRAQHAPTISGTRIEIEQVP